MTVAVAVTAARALYIPNWTGQIILTCDISQDIQAHDINQNCSFETESFCLETTTESEMVCDSDLKQQRA